MAVSGNSVYHPPPRRSFWQTGLSVVIGICLTGCVFIILPLTQIFEERHQPPPPPQELSVTTPPPPPPPPEEKEPPPETSSLPESAEPKMEEVVEPIQLRQLEITLEPEMADAIQGDFTFDFALSGPVVSTFEVFELSDVDQPPSAIYRAPPVYPNSLERAGIVGKAVVRFIVDESGAPLRPKVVETTHPAFGAAAINAVKQSRFKPSRKSGKPVAVWVQIPYRFSP